MGIVCPVCVSVRMVCAVCDGVDCVMVCAVCQCGMCVGCVSYCALCVVVYPNVYIPSCP